MAKQTSQEESKGHILEIMKLLKSGNAEIVGIFGNNPLFPLPMMAINAGVKGNFFIWLFFQSPKFM